MGYFTVEYTYTDKDGKQRGGSCSSPSDTVEQLIERLNNEFAAEGSIVHTIGERPKNGGKPYAVDILIDFILSKNDKMTREELLKHDWMILNTDRKDYREGVKAVPLHEAKVIIDADDFDDFVYIRSAGLVLFDVGSQTSHQMFCGQWMAIEETLLQGKGYDEWFASECQYSDGDGQELFLEENKGIFMSRAYQARTTYKGSNWTMQGAERQVFKSLTDFRTM